GELAAGRLLRDRFQPRALLLELVAQRLLHRREGEDDAIAGELDLLRLRDHHVVEHVLVLADFGEEGILARGLAGAGLAGAGCWVLGAWCRCRGPGAGCRCRRRLSTADRRLLTVY